MTIDVSGLVTALDELSTAMTDKLAASASGLVPEDTLPISSWGDLSDGPLPINFGVANTHVSFTADIPAVIRGRRYLMPALEVDLAINKTFFVYVGLSAGTAEYRISETRLTETIILMLIGTVTTDAVKVLRNTIRRVRRIDTYHFDRLPLDRPYMTTAVGLSSSVLPVSDSGYWKQGIQVVSSWRSWSATLFTNEGRIRAHRVFDVFGSVAEAQAMATYLNSLPDDTNVILTTTDEPLTNSTEASLRTALIRCGATATKLDALKYRGAYILLGNAAKVRPVYEFVAGTIANDPNAALQVVFDLDGLGNYTGVTQTL